MTTDHLNIQADALVDLAIVQEAAGAADEAETALATAVRHLRDQGQCGAGARKAGGSPRVPSAFDTIGALDDQRGTTMAMGSRIFPHLALVNGATVEVKGPTGDWDPYAESATFAVIVGQVNRQTGAIVLAKGRSTETSTPAAVVGRRRGGARRGRRVRAGHGRGLGDRGGEDEAERRQTVIDGSDRFRTSDRIRARSRTRGASEGGTPDPRLFGANGIPGG